jgi:hypothetical protein
MPKIGDDDVEIKRFAGPSKNFGNYTIARDPRMRIKWRAGNKTGRWLADLPDVRLSYPPDTDEKALRHPNAFDMNVLFYLLAEAARHKSASVSLLSYAAILKALGYSTTPRNRQRLKSAVALWSKLSIRFHKWWWAGKSSVAVKRKKFVPGPYRQGGNAPRLLPPPISKVEGSVIKLHQDWVNDHAKYRIKVFLSLPRTASAQNVVLCALASAATGCEGATYRRRLRRFCRKIGVEHRTRNRILKKAFEDAGEYFERNGWVFVPITEDDRIWFFLKSLEDKSALRNADLGPAAPAKPIIERIPRQPKPAPSVEIERFSARDDYGRSIDMIRLADGTVMDEVDYRAMQSAKP